MLIKKLEEACHVHSFIHSFIYLLNKAIKKCAAKCTIEQDSKAKALTAAQKLQNYTKTIQQTVNPQ